MSSNKTPEEIHMRFAENGNVRKWSFEPFKEAEVKYIREDIAAKIISDQAMKDLIVSGQTFNRLTLTDSGDLQSEHIPLDQIKLEMSQEP